MVFTCSRSSSAMLWKTSYRVLRGHKNSLQLPEVSDGQINPHHQSRACSSWFRASQPDVHSWEALSTPFLDARLGPLQSIRAGSIMVQPLVLRTFQDSQAFGELLTVENGETHLQDGLRLGSVPVVCRESNMYRSPDL